MTRKRIRLRNLFLTSTVIVAFSVSCDLDGLLGPTDSGSSGISSKKIAEGLKEALAVGIDSASSELHQAGGYLTNEIIKILLPSDVAQALTFIENLETEIQLLGLLAGPFLGYDFGVFDNMRDSMISSMNRAAEMAAPKSVDIFKTAIFQMTLDDATNILYRDSTAATSYLKEKTFSPLTDLYSPFVDTMLTRAGAHQAWNSISTNYNAVASLYNSLGDPTLLGLPALPFDSLTTDLATYTTGEALDGLFWAVGQEESRIRTDPVARVTELLREVFSLLDE